MSSLKVVSCHCKWHMHIAHQTLSLNCVYVTPDEFKLPCYSFSLPFWKRKKGCGRESGMLWLSATLCTRWKARIKLEANCLIPCSRDATVHQPTVLTKLHRLLCLSLTKQTGFPHWMAETELPDNLLSTGHMTSLNSIVWIKKGHSDGS